MGTLAITWTEHSTFTVTFDVEDGYSPSPAEAAGLVASARDADSLFREVTIDSVEPVVGGQCQPSGNE